MAGQIGAQKVQIRRDQAWQGGALIDGKPAGHILLDAMADQLRDGYSAPQRAACIGRMDAAQQIKGLRDCGRTALLHPLQCFLQHGGWLLV